MPILRADADRDPLRRALLAVLPGALGLDVLPGIRAQRLELQALPLAAVLYAGLQQIVEDRPLEVRCVIQVCRLLRGRDVSAEIVLCGDRLSTVNRPATRTFCVSSYGLS